jgi:hypothetical protein
MLAEPAQIAELIVTRNDRNLVVNPAHPRFHDVPVGAERPVAWGGRLPAR